MTRKRILYLILTGISALLFAFYVNAYFSEEGIHQSMVDSYNKTYPDKKITINAPDTLKIIKENEQTYGIAAFLFFKPHIVKLLSRE